jgi:protease-4
MGIKFFLNIAAQKPNPMRNFFASLFGALIGIFLAFFLVFLLILGIVSSKMKNFKEGKAESITTPSVLVMRLNHPIVERTPKSLNFSFGEDKEDKSEKSGLDDILVDIHHAATDNNIKGIFLNLSETLASPATLEAIRDELLKFKTSGKFIIANSAGYSQGSYYLASVSDKVYIYPDGDLLFKGLSAHVLFFKHALEKLGISIQVFRHGRFKSFVEPFILDKMSDANRLQTRMLVGSIWNTMLDGIGSSRHLTPAEMNKMADSMDIRTADDAVRFKLADASEYTDVVFKELREKMGVQEDKKIPTVGLDEYRKSFKVDKDDEGIIAVVFATGEIKEGEGDDEGTLGSARIIRAIKNAASNDNVKAIVLRVNSPGGAVTPSDMIWREVTLAKKKKPFIVSMGDVAASGGYYISCAADKIVAEPTTITGSIGVFGIIPNAKELLNDKLGLSMDTVNTNAHSGAGSVAYPLEPSEQAVIQGVIEKIYNTFLTRVSDGRNIPVAMVDSIAQGRVWSGTDARKIGLVDTLGGLDVAISIAAKKANLTSYNIKELPAQLNPLRTLLKKYGMDEETKILKEELGEYYEPVMTISNSLKTQGIQARMPYDITIW